MVSGEFLVWSVVGAGGGRCFACLLVGGRFLLLRMVSGRCLNQYMVGGWWSVVGVLISIWLVVGGLWSVAGRWAVVLYYALYVRKSDPQA